MLNEEPIRKPIGRDTVLCISKSNLYLLLRFWDPRQRKNISNIAVAIFRINSCILKNILKTFN